MEKSIVVNVEKSQGCLSVVLTHNAQRFSLKQASVLLGLVCFFPSFSPIYVVPCLLILAWMVFRALFRVREGKR